jgi:hypothetical protein
MNRSGYLVNTLEFINEEKRTIDNEDIVEERLSEREREREREKE